MPDQRTIRINDGIGAPELRVIGNAGENLGVMPTAVARELARKAGLDLIEIAPAASPPVAKIMDFGKYQYQERKKQREARGRSHRTETKNVQIKIATGDHDLGIKGARAAAFLKEGHRVKIELFLPGRAKYLDRTFLQGKLDRALEFIHAEYKIAETAKPNPKGLALIIEPAKQI